MTSAYDRDPRVEQDASDQSGESWLVYPFGIPGSAGRGREVITYMAIRDDQGHWNMFDEAGWLLPQFSHKDSLDDVIHALIGDPW